MLTLHCIPMTSQRKVKYFIIHKQFLTLDNLSVNVNITLVWAVCHGRVIERHAEQTFRVTLTHHVLDWIHSLQIGRRSQFCGSHALTAGLQTNHTMSAKLRVRLYVRLNRPRRSPVRHRRTTGFIHIQLAEFRMTSQMQTQELLE